MNAIIDLPWSSLGFMYLLLIVPLLIFYLYDIDLNRSLLWAALRMTVQLFLVALYLGFLFKYNQWWLNILYLLVMIVVANHTIIRGTSLSLRKTFFPLLWGLLVGVLLNTAFLVLIIINPEPLWEARYVIPVGGMILGNILRYNIIALDRFYGDLRQSEERYFTYLFLGANLQEATKPFMTEAIRAAMAPAIASMSAMGIVALPGMMTGQILSGSSPWVAIKYQLAIMLVIFTSSILSAFLTLRISIKSFFNHLKMLRKDVFIQSTKNV